MALTEDVAREFLGGDEETYPVAAGAVIYRGAIVGEDGNGYARPMQSTDAFLGLAMGRADNRGGAAGDAAVRVRTRGRVVGRVDGFPAAGAPVVALGDDLWFDGGASPGPLAGFVSIMRDEDTRIAVIAFDAFWARVYYQAVADAAP